MPSNRQHLDREVKTAEILRVAEKMLLGDGYEATTMAAVARGAGISSNAVYWYFPSKDDLLAAVLRRRLERAAGRPPPEGTFLDQILLALSELDALAGLTAVIHERARHSPALAEIHETFHRLAEEVVSHGFQQEGLSAEDAPMAAAALIAMIDGVHLHNTTRDPAARDRLVAWTVRRLLT